MFDREGSPGPEAGGEKALLRSWVKTQPRANAEESKIVAEVLAKWLREQAPARILTYDAMPGELAIESVAEGLSDLHRFFLTRTPEQGPLTVHPHEGPVEAHGFGFRQPTSVSVEVDPASLDLVLAPGLCFDHRGVRLGWGRGYYDELLARMPNVWAVVGVTLARFVVDYVPLESHDRRMTHLATESGVRPVLP